MADEDRTITLRQMKICRFCMDEDGPFTNMYVKDGKQSVPLPLQIMACVAIEVFANDGMPQLICDNCRTSTIQAYLFKTTCKKSDDALKIFLATGQMVKPFATKGSSPVPMNSVRSIKRECNDKASEPEYKKPKQEIELKKNNNSSEIVTLNYTSKVGAIDENTLGPILSDTEIEPEQIEVFEDQEIETIDEENSEDEAIKINPTLTVDQVATDVFPCTQCERSFPLKQLLDLHMVNHDRERSYECPKCGRKFFTKYDLAKHHQTHSSDKPFACVACNKQFSRESLLHRHEKIHTDVPKYLCTSCDRTYLTKEDLDAHVETHKKKRPFTCRICDKGFVFKQGLQRHLVTHTEEKPHKCNYCEASFSSAIKLMRHITSHAGLRPYPCKICSRTFLLSHHLTRHMRSHYASKAQPLGQHKCDVCSMSFRRKDSLINHSAIHSMCNLRCVICNTSFVSAKEVKDHITTHLAGLPYPCDRCDYSFETQDQLEMHEIKHAEMEYEEQIEREVTMESNTKEGDHAAQEIDDEEDEEFTDDEDTEYTITNAGNIEHVEVRRSKRESKIKNYAQFLKDELGSDIEDELIQPTSKEEQEDEDEDPLAYETIKPIVRSEGTKVYSRRAVADKTKATQELHLPKSSMVPPEDQTGKATLEQINFSKQIVNSLPDKQFVDMKIGQRRVRVQKLMMTKAEIELMAKQGKIEVKGETILLKNTTTVNKILQPLKEAQEKAPLKNITIENIIDDPKPSTSQRMAVKKTYKRTPSVQMKSEEPEVSSLANDDKTDILQILEN